MSFFSNLFGKNEPELLTKDFSWLGTDMHSHLIPGIDDGVKTMDESIALIEELMALGFKKIITSPHIMSDGYNNTSAEVLRGRDAVREELLKRNISVYFDAAAEYYLDETIFDKIKKRDLLTMGNNNVLVELSYLTKPFNTTKFFFELRSAGYNVILAHPERYPYYYQDSLEDYAEIKDAGVQFQLNLASLTGVYGKGAKSIGARMIEEGMIDYLGTDLHNARHMENIKKTFESPMLDKARELPLFNSKL